MYNTHKYCFVCRFLRDRGGETYSGPVSDEYSLDKELLKYTSQIYVLSYLAL